MENEPDILRIKLQEKEAVILELEKKVRLTEFRAKK